MGDASKVVASSEDLTEGAAACLAVEGGGRRMASRSYADAAAGGRGMGPVYGLGQRRFSPRLTVRKDTCRPPHAEDRSVIILRRTPSSPQFSSGNPQVREK